MNLPTNPLKITTLGHFRGYCVTTSDTIDLKNMFLFSKFQLTFSWCVNIFWSNEILTKKHFSLHFKVFYCHFYNLRGQLIDRLGRKTLTSHNSPIFDEYQSQCSKVLALLWKLAHQDNSNNASQPTSGFKVGFHLQWIKSFGLPSLAYIIDWRVL